VLKNVVPIKNGGSLKRVGKSSNGYMFTVRDLRMLSLFDEQEEDPDAILLLCTAKDKYEAAVSVFHCHCHEGLCKCTKVLSADIFLPSKIDPQQAWKIGQRTKLQCLSSIAIVMRASVSVQRFYPPTSFFHQKSTRSNFGRLGNECS
jgi:hypothetical protein